MMIDAYYQLMKINRTVTQPALRSARPAREAAAPQPRESFQPSNGLEWAGLVGGRLALMSTPVAAGAGLITAALTGNPVLGAKVGLGIAAGAAAAGGALGATAYYAFKDIDIPS